MKKVLLFTSKTCAPCAALKPVIAQQQAELGFELETHVLEENNVPFADYKVRQVPTVIAVDGEGEIGRFSGGVSSATVLNHLKNWGF